MTDTSWIEYECEMRAHRLGHRKDKPRCAFQHGTHIDSLPVEVNQPFKGQLPSLVQEDSSMKTSVRRIIKMSHIEFTLLAKKVYGQDLGWQQRAAANLGVNHGTISRWVHGHARIPVAVERLLKIMAREMA